MSNNWNAELQQAERAARRAGEMLAARSASALSVLEESGHDIKLSADREAESIIVKHLSESGYAILAEEQGEIGDVSSRGPVWVVDPLDGTMNYSRGLPICCTSISMLADGAPVLGAIYDFNRDEMYSGLASGGAWLNGRPMSVSKVNEAGKAILATGLPSYRDYSMSALQPTLEQFQRFKKVRMLGSAALMLAYLAAGRVDAYQEEDIMLWDVAAGLALVQGAGGVVHLCDSARHRWGRRVWCASHPSIWGVLPES